jgi:hypothetical protein
MTCAPKAPASQRGVAELRQSNSVLKRSNQDLEPGIDFAPLGRGCATRLAGQACKFAVFIGLPAAPARAAKSVHPTTHRAPWSPRLDAPPLPSSVVEWRTFQSRTAPKSSTVRCVNIATRFRVMVHSWPDLSDAGVRMSPAQVATRIYSGPENMPSYRGNLKSEELDSLLAFLASQQSERLPKRPALQGLGGQGAANGR